MFVIRVDRRSFKKENPKKQKCLNVIYFSGTNTSTHTHKLNRLSYHLSMLQATCPPLKPLAFCSLSFVSRKNSTRKWFVDEQIAGASPKEKSFSFFLVHQLQLISTWCCTFKSVTSEFVANPSDKWHYPEVFRVKMERSNWRCDLTNSQCVSVCLCVCVCVCINMEKRRPPSQFQSTENGADVYLMVCWWPTEATGPVTTSMTSDYFALSREPNPKCQLPSSFLCVLSP